MNAMSYQRIEAGPHPTERYKLSLIALIILALFSLGAVCTSLGITSAVANKKIFTAFPALAIPIMFAWIAIKRYPIQINGRVILLFSATALIFLGHLTVVNNLLWLKIMALTLFSTLFPICLGTLWGQDKALYIFIKVMLALSAILVIGSVFFPQLLFVPTPEGYTMTRTGWFANPNPYGGVAAIGFASAMTICSDDQNRPSKVKFIALVLFAAICLLAVYHSRSRGSALAVGAFVGVQVLIRLSLALFSSRHRLTDPIIAIGSFLFLFLAGFLLFNYSAASGFIDKNAHNYHGSHSRLDVWNLVFQDFKSAGIYHWIFGGGLDASFTIPIKYNITGTHNAYLKLLVETGIIGLVTFAACIFRTLFLLAKDALQSSLGISILSLYLSILIHSIFESHIFSFGTTFGGLIFWAAMCFKRTHP